MKLQLWEGALWQVVNGLPYAYCLEHRTRLDILDEYGQPSTQESSFAGEHPPNLVCPKDNKHFKFQIHDFRSLRRRYLAAIEAINLKDADIVDIDGYQIPIAKTRAAEEDSEYWVEARINETKRGMQLVVYAGRRGAHDKAQIFVDLEHDKISFDQNNVHPNDVFTKLTAEFESGKKATLEK